jgi:glycosyltransferase involved in cell wall biosynthesis
MPPQLCVFVTSYRSPRALRLVLLALGLEVERARARRAGLQVELIVADDGDPDHQSRPPALEAAGRGWFARVRRLWQTHDGYGKVRLANKGLVAAEAPLLLYLDGDMLLAPGALEVHLRLAGARRYVAGHTLRLGPAPSSALTEDDLHTGRFASPAWTLGHFLRGGIEQKAHYPLLRAAGLGPLLRKTGSGGFNGGCTSVHKALLEEVNGWDESLPGYGFDDTDLGHRLQNAGAVPVDARLEGMTVHLWHERPYRGDDATYERKRREVAGTLHGTEVRARRGIAELGVHDPGEWEELG